MARIPKDKPASPLRSFKDEATEQQASVSKSIPLLSLCESDLTLIEFKILDLYLARINPHEPERREVVFTKGEMETLLGVDRIKQDALEGRLKNLVGTSVTLKDKTERKGFKVISLFSIAAAEQDEFGLWTVTLKCSEETMKYFFNIESLSYFRYKLRNIIQLTSRYSYLLFIYLEHNRWRSPWTDSVDEVRKALGCDDVTYQSFKRFNDLILKKAKKELQDKTECKFEYTTVKSGRYTKAITFTLKSIAKDQLEIAPVLPPPPTTDLNRLDTTAMDKVTAYLYEPLTDSGFTQVEFDYIINIIPNIKRSCLNKFNATPEECAHEGMNEVTVKRRKYLENRYLKMLKYAPREKSKYAYFVTMLEKDMGENHD